MVGEDQVVAFFGDFMGVSALISTLSLTTSTAMTLRHPLTWHLEWEGLPFQFSRGCTFYRSDPNLHGQQQIQIV